MAYTAKEIRDGIPSGLSLSDQMGYSVGTLVMCYAQTEHLFFGLLSCFIHGQQGQPQIVWLNINNSTARAYLVQRLAIASALERPVVEEIKQHVKDFKAIGKTRNLFAHAAYRGDFKTGDMLGLESYDLVDDERIFVTHTRTLDQSLLNECVEAIAANSRLGARLWQTLVQVRELTGSQQLTLPEALPEYLEYLESRRSNAQN
jgi:hypothetical protein